MFVEKFFFINAIAAAAALAFSMFWYSPKILGDSWAKLAGVNTNSCGKDCTRKICATFVTYYIMAMAMHMIIIWSGAATWQQGLGIAVITGVGLSAPSVLMPSLWEARPTKLFVITAGNLLFSLAFMGAIIGHMIGLDASTAQ